MFEQPFVLLIFIGLALKAGGFLVRDELWLRALVFTGTGFDIAFYALQSPAIWGSVLTNTVLVGVNGALIFIGLSIGLYLAAHIPETPFAFQAEAGGCHSLTEISHQCKPPSQRRLCGQR
jgi:hypothetical protein